MKRKPLLLSLLAYLSGMILNAEPERKSENKFMAMIETTTSGESLFLKHADDCLIKIEQAAQNMGVKGVAVLAYIPGDTSSTWISRMKVAGALSNTDANFLAIAYSKAAEMADTHQNSGADVREVLHGEFGYQGGIIKKVDSGYILAVFSGATGEQDAEIASKGVNQLYSFY